MKGSAFQISGPALRDFELVADVDSQIMMMPSLFKYFTIVGGGLLALLIAVDAVMSPGGPKPVLLEAKAPNVAAIKHDSRASLVERLRAEEAARTAARSSSTPLQVTISTYPEPRTEQVNIPAAVAPPPEATSTVKPVQQNTSPEKVRKKYLAHAHRKSMKAPSHHQDQMYYGYAALKAAQRRDR
jgi:hypothetical protein